MKEENDGLERGLEGLRDGLSNCKSRAQVSFTVVSTSISYSRFLPDQYKEENRNLGIILRDLRIQFSDLQATVQRLGIENKHVARLNEVCDASDRHENERLVTEKRAGGLVLFGTSRTSAKADS